MTAVLPEYIDLSLVSPELAPDCNWETTKDSLGSAHLPISISLHKMSTPQDSSKDEIPKYNYKRADWDTLDTALAAVNIEM